MKTIKAPFKISVRGDGEYLRMFVCMSDKEPLKDGWLVATLRQAVARNCPEAVAAFNKLGEAIATGICRDVIGVEPDHFTVQKKWESN